MSLTRYIIRRMLLQVFVLVGVSSLTFFMMIIMPGDPSTILMETTGGISTQAVDKFRERWGFDQPAYMQYLTFMGNLVRGDFGESFVTRKEIRTELASFLPATAELSVVAFLMAVIMAIPAGILAAVKRNALPDHIVRVVSLFGTSMPIFWFAIILLLVFFYYLGWVPSSQRIALTLDIPQTVTGFYTIDTLIVGDFRGFVSSLHHLALPAFVLAFSVVGLLARVTRTSMLEVLGEDYIRMGPRQGAPQQGCSLPSRAPKCPDSDSDDLGSPGGRPSVRRRSHGDDLRLARTWTVRGSVNLLPRPCRGNFRRADNWYRLLHGHSRRGHRCSDPRPAHHVHVDVVAVRGPPLQAGSLWSPPHNSIVPPPRYSREHGRARAF